VSKQQLKEILDQLTCRAIIEHDEDYWKKSTTTILKMHQMMLVTMKKRRMKKRSLNQASFLTPMIARREDILILVKTSGRK
jgi:hypothetical protein